LIKIYDGEEFFCSSMIENLVGEHRETELNIHLDFSAKGYRSFLNMPIFAKVNVFVMSWDEFSRVIKNTSTILLNIPPSTIILVKGGNIDKRKTEFNFVKENKFSYTFFEALTEKTAIEWLSKIKKQKNISITAKAINLLVHYLGVSARTLYTELIRLTEIAQGTEITENIIKLHTSVEREFKLYELSNILVFKKIRDTFVVMRFLKNTFDVFSIVRYLQSFYLNLIYAKLNKALLEDKYQRFTIDKFREAANRFTLNELLEKLGYCYSAEVDIKSSVDDSVVMSNLLCKLLK